MVGFAWQKSCPCQQLCNRQQTCGLNPQQQSSSEGVRTISSQLPALLNYASYRLLACSVKINYSVPFQFQPVL